MTKAPEAAADKGGKAVVLDAETLKAEVRAFASSLGFPAQGAAGAFDYDDFAPQKAAKKISAAADQPKRQQQQRDGSTDAAARQGRKGGQQQQKQQQQKDRQQQQQQQQKGGKHSEQQQAARGGHQQQQQQQQQGNGLTKQEREAAAKEEAVRTRTWVDSVGPRPGEARGRSLLGKDEPSLWYEAAAAAGLPQPSSSSQPPLGEDASEVLRSKAEALLEREGQLFEREVQGRNAADARWLSQVRRSGTTADKVAAMSLMVGSSAAGGLKSLDGLMGLMGKSGGGKQVVLAAMEALQELFLSSLLPDRKLRVLEAQPLQALPAGKEGERCLLLWGVEDAVKRRYQQFVALLEKCSTDNLDFVKERATKTIFKLLTAKPEAEQALLSALVNKLGDPSRKLASDAAFLLGQLLLQHPAMKAVVVREVERFLFRPGLSDRGRYYAVTFLNQIPMSNRPQEGGSALALKLVDVYFSLFKLLLEGRLGTAAARQQQQEAAAAAAGGKHRHSKKKGDGKHGGHQQKQQKHQQQRRKGGSSSGDGGDGDGSSDAAAAAAAESVQQAGELDARMLSALITGVRRAFPYVEPDKVEPLVEAHGEALFKLVHTAPFTVALQALMLMYQLLAGRNAVSERYYRALYAVLLTEGATGAAGVRGPQFLSLLVKSMKGDASIKRVAAFAKRLLQVSCHAPAPWAAGGLLLLSEVLKAHPGLWAAVQQPEDAAAAAEVFRDAPEDSTAAAAAAGGGSDRDDEEEVFRDVEDSDDEGAAAAAAAGSKQQQQQQQQGKQKQGMQKHQQAAANGSAAAAAAAAAAGGGKQQQQQWPKEGCYDMRKREPLYANAEGSCWWELMLLAKHSHPSVAAFARSLLAGVPVVYTGDPLRDLGTTAFLDKFVNKKPKAAPKGTSLMQPSHSLTAAAAAGSSDAAAFAAAAGSSAAADVTTLGPNAFADLAEADVAPDQLFFHKFFNLSAVKSKSQTAAAARAAKAAAAAAKAAAGDGGSSEDGDMDGGELGAQGIESDGDLESEEVDRALAEAEGVEDDGLGDPDVGYDYDSLLAAMAADGSSDGGSSSDGGGSSEEGEEEAASGSGDGSSGSAGGSSSGEEEEEGESEEGEWVMLEEGAAAATVNGSSKAGKGEKQKKKRKLDAGADEEEGSDDDVNPFDLASPSSSDDDGEQQQQQQKGSRKKQRKEQQPEEQQQQPEGGSHGEEGQSDLDLDIDDIMGGSDEDMSQEEEGDMLLTAGEELGGSSSDDEPAAAPGSSGAQQQKGGKGKQKGRQKGAGLFADASAYDDYFAQFDKAAAAAAEDGGEGGAAAADGDAAAAGRRGKRGGGGVKKAGGGKKHRAA